MKKFLIFIIGLCLTIISVLADEVNVLPSVRGIVKNFEYVDVDDSFEHTRQVVEVQLLNGGNKGSILYLENSLTGNPYYDIKLKKGVKVLLHVEEDEGNLIYSIEDIERSSILLILSILFCSLLIYVGRKKGIYSLVSIILTCILILNLLSPMILAGVNPAIATFLICLFSTIITMYFVGGFNRKSTSAIIGCMLSLLLAAILSLLTVKFASLNGFSNEHSMFLYSTYPNLNFVLIAVSTMILATLGAVMDVAMSIASTINEISEVDANKTIKELFSCGMNVGRDIIGTMANTLILVYLGASLPLVLLASNIDMQKFMNLNQVVTEVASALIGSCAIVICVPLTAFISANLVKRKQENLIVNLHQD